MFAAKDGSYVIYVELKIKIANLSARGILNCKPLKNLNKVYQKFGSLSRNFSKNMKKL